MDDFIIEGYDEFIETIDKLVKNVSPAKIEPELKKGAQIFAREMRRLVPIGPTGNLKKSIRAKQLKRWGNQPAPSIAAINRKKAPHAYMVMHGSHGQVRQVRPPRKVIINGKFAVIDNTGIMPPNSFFSDAIESKQGEVLYRIENAVGKLIEEGMK